MFCLERLVLGGKPRTKESEPGTVQDESDMFIFIFGWTTITVCLPGCPLTTDPVEGQRRLSSNLHQSPCSGGPCRKKIPRSNTCEMFIIVITLIIHEIIGIRCCLLPAPPLSEEHLAKKIAASTGQVIGFGTRRLVVRTTESAALLFIGDKHSLKEQQPSVLRRRGKD